MGNYECRENEGCWRRVCLGLQPLLCSGLGRCCTRWDFLLWLRVIPIQTQRSQGAVSQPCRESQVSFRKLEFNLWLRFMWGTLLSLEIPRAVLPFPRICGTYTPCRIQHQPVYFYSSCSKLFMQKIWAGGGWRNNPILSYSSLSAGYSANKTFSINKLTSPKLLLLI